MTMERWVGRVALVTGASSGMGAAIAELLVKHGMKVVGCARNETRIQELADKLRGEKGSLKAMKCDLAKEEDILHTFADIKKEYGGVDVCVNNAGLSHKATLLSGEADKWRNMLDVNVLALSICSRETYKSKKEKSTDCGHIIHINSLSGHSVGPKDALFYSATKFAVTALTEGLRVELREAKSHIRVSAISPGLCATEFAYRMRGDEAANKMYTSIECLQPKDIADSVVYVLSAPQHVQVHDIVIRPTEQVP